jgi:hypothetical protein
VRVRGDSVRVVRWYRVGADALRQALASYGTRGSARDAPGWQAKKKGPVGPL